MRLWTALVLLTLTTPVYAQTLGSTSGASSTTPTIAAPGLAAAGIETCLGSTAGGLSLMCGGITFGSTKVDEGCTIRLLARQLYAFGFQKAALALMCQDAHVERAMDEVAVPRARPSPPKPARRSHSCRWIAPPPRLRKLARRLSPVATFSTSSPPKPATQFRSPTRSLQSRRRSRRGLTERPTLADRPQIHARCSFGVDFRTSQSWSVERREIA
jgi:hypothetical protein